MPLMDRIPLEGFSSLEEGVALERVRKSRAERFQRLEEAREKKKSKPKAKSRKSDEDKLAEKLKKLSPKQLAKLKENL